jgi:glutamyl-tRNA synthetase
MVNYLMTLGWAPAGDTEIVPWSKVVEEFRLEDVNHSPAYFDLKKLAAFNGEHIRMLGLDDFVAACAPWVSGPDAPWPPDRFDDAVFRELAPLVQTRVVTLAEVASLVDFVFLPDPPDDEGSWSKAMSAEWAGDVLRETIDAYAAAAWEPEALKAALEEVGARRELKLGKVQAPVRVAVTGRTVGPPLFESLAVLGRDETVRRLARALGRLGAAG